MKRNSHLICLSTNESICHISIGLFTMPDRQFSEKQLETICISIEIVISMQTVSVLQRQFVQINSVLEISFVGRLFKYKQITVMHVCYLFECKAVCVLFCFRLSPHRKKRYTRNSVTDF